MPIPWMVVLKNIPWTDVIRNAPNIADSAKKLWNTVSTYASTQESENENLGTVGNNSGAGVSLQSRLAAMEDAVEQLHEQMLVSSDLIKTLAEQNSQLIARIEMIRRRIKALTIALCFTVMISVASLVIVLTS